MKKLTFVLLALVIAALGFGMTAAQDAVDRTGWPETFIIGVYPGDNIEKALQANQPLADYLTAKLGVRTVIITGTSYNAVVEAMRAGRADAFEVGPFSYTLAAQVANAEALVVGNYSTTVDTSYIPGYYSVMFTLKGSGVRSIADLAGRTFAFTDPASTSGYLVPATEIMNAQGFESKDQLDTFFAEAVFAGNHPSSVLAVANGTTVAGATFDDNLVAQVDPTKTVLPAGTVICGIPEGTAVGAEVFHNAMTDEEIAKIYDECPEGAIAVFDQSPLIPQTPFAVNANLPQSFKDAVTAALLAIKDDQAVVDALGRFYMDPRTVDASLASIDALYDPLRVIAKKLDLDLTKR